MKIKVEVDLTPAELVELTQNGHQSVQLFQTQLWQQFSQQLTQLNPLMAGESKKESKDN